MQAIQEIRNNIHDRTISQATKEQAQNIADVLSEIIEEAKRTYNEKLKGNDFCFDDLTVNETRLCSTSPGLTTISLKGFSDPSERKESYTGFDIAAKFSTTKGDTLTLTSKVADSNYGDGAELEYYEIHFNDEAITDFLSEVNLDENIRDLITITFDSYNHYDISIAPLSDTDTLKIARILGVH